MKLAVLGYPVKHSLSPAMHNAALQEMGIDGEYIAIETKPDRLEATLEKLKKEGYLGCNLTIPHKQAALEYILNKEDMKPYPGSINTIKFSEEALVGFSTDGYGLKTALWENFGVPVEDAKIFIAGIGGAGRAVAVHLKWNGATVSLGNRTKDKAVTLAMEIGLNENDVIGFDECDKIKEHDIIINATSVGMKADDPPLLPKEAFREGQLVMDMIYVQNETPFMRPAIEAGAKTINGLDMLLYQGVRSLEIWTDMEVPVNTMRNALKKAAGLV